MARRIARNREVLGLHYPSDSTAGRELGDALFECLTNAKGQGASFEKLLDTAREEWGVGGRKG